MTSRLHIVLGGAKSGKTAHALSHAVTAWQGVSSGCLWYLATAEVHDDEMAAKVQAHQSERQTYPWQTIEEPLEISTRLHDFGAQDVVVLDSFGMWISTLLMRDIPTQPQIDTLCEALQNCPAHIVIIADEVGHGLVPEHALGRRFCEANGSGNQQLCAQAHSVDFVLAGLVQRWKYCTK